MAELKPIEVIMRIDYVATGKTEVVCHVDRVQELVRCKDCDYWDDALEAPRDKGCYFCGCHGGYTRAEYYCADGERRSE